MLEIYIYNGSNSGFLDLPGDAKLEMEQVKDIFDEDLLVSEYSLPLEAAWTDNNKRLLHYAERLQNFSTAPGYWVCDVISDGTPVLQKAKMTLLGKSGTMNYRKGKFTFNIAGPKGLLGVKLQNKYLTDLTFETISWTSGPSREFATSFMKGHDPEWSTIFSFVPVAILDFMDTDRADFDDIFLAEDTVNTVIVNGTNTDWDFGRREPDNPTKLITALDPLYRDARTVPFIKVKYLLRKIFEEAGYKVGGDFLDTAAFDDLLLLNNYAIEKYDYYVAIDTNRSINLKNHVPKMLQTDFIKLACSFCNMYPRFSGINSVELRYRKTTIQQNKTADATNIAALNFESAITPQEGTGVTVRYSGNSNDGYLSERVQEFDKGKVVATVAKFDDLQTISIGRPLTTDDIALVTAENMYYKFADGTVSPTLWDAYSENLDEYITEDGATSVDVLASPLAQFCEVDDSTGITVRRNKVGASLKGSYNAKSGPVFNE
ncbi:MAG TPA: hypothetical protein PL045_03605, partial [Chitinophagaceae bacterium]|nr:hypothetical protein [Chitinophagaceae bacterium]